MNIPIVSFCIPTFNRINQVYSCVQKLLAYKGDDIEVVVSDNGSPDGTMERLSHIKDKRFLLTGFSQNMLYTANLLNVIKNAKGDFVFLLSDEDTVVIENIPVLIDIIMKFGADASMILGSGIGADSAPYTLGFFTKGYHAYKKHAFTHGYMTGIILNRKMLDYNDENMKRFDFHYYLYPHILLVTEATLKGTVITVNRVFTIQGNVEFIDFSDKNFSGVYKGKHFLDHENVIVGLKEILLHLKLSNFNDIEKASLYFGFIISQAYHAVYAKINRLDDVEYAKLYNYKSEGDKSTLEIYETVINWGYDHIIDLVDNTFTREAASMWPELLTMGDEEFLHIYESENKSPSQYIVANHVIHARMMMMQLGNRFDNISLYEAVNNYYVKFDVAKLYFLSQNYDKAREIFSCLADGIKVPPNIKISSFYYHALCNYSLSNYLSARQLFEETRRITMELTNKEHNKAVEYIQKIAQEERKK